MKLAETLGMSVKRCKREVDSAEFTFWIAKWKLDNAELEELRKASNG
jgi:hypothetical protein